VAVASLVVNSIGIKFGLTPLLWANVGKIAGIAVASIWNFLGYKFVVFKK
jgi:putative flippase GtrA